MALDERHPVPPDPANPVSGAFVDAIAKMVDEDDGGGWGDPIEEAFEAMRDVEKQLFATVRWALLSMAPPEAAGVIDWWTKRHAEEEDY